MAHAFSFQELKEYLYPSITPPVQSILVDNDPPARAQPRSFSVAYYAITPSGSRSRFTMNTSLSNLIGGSGTETAVLFYLKAKHPGCEILIQSLSFT